MRFGCRYAPPGLSGVGRDAGRGEWGKGVGCLDGMDIFLTEWLKNKGKMVMDDHFRLGAAWMPLQADPQGFENLTHSVRKIAIP